MASHSHLPLVVLVAMAPVEDPVEASPVVDFPVGVGFLLLWTGPVEILLVLDTFASASSLALLGSRELLLAVAEQAQ